ncbi:MAG: hypothetical protein AB7N76_30845 [Planctomycetota bacterium]
MNAPTPRALPIAVSSAPAAAAVLEPEELRTSNEVEDFEYSRSKAVWYTLRLLLALPFLPLWPFMLAYEARDWGIARNYPKTMAYLLRTMLVHIRHGSFVRLLKYNLVLGPDEVKARISRRRGACTRCAKCCRQYDCIFLGQDKESKDFICKIYKTDYWYYGTCGRYPVDQTDIDDHACPGFSFPDSGKKSA